jgi:16S rRNA (cytidine1402-2'-O)-methyltransferase
MSAENPAVPSAQHGRLLICATPIGNLRDVTLRVLDALREADILACEDTRHTQILLAHHGISARRLTSFHEHNERARASALVARMCAGATVALVSDAGTPLISDPGFALVNACLRQGVPVHVLPGPSAAVAGLIASGLSAQRWRFVGFLPRKAAELERLLARTHETTVAFESPRRLPRVLRLLAELDQQRAVAVCRELTKLHEQVRRGTAGELATHYEQNQPRGEIVLVIGAAAPRTGRRAEALEALQRLVEAGARPRQAASVIAGLTGVRANELYRELTDGGR